MNYFGTVLSRKEVLARVHPTPVTGGDVLHVSTGRFSFQVLPKRGLDIFNASYQAVPLAFCCKAGMKIHDGDEFCDHFFGGLLTTCGPDNVGPSCTYRGSVLPQHGSYTLHEAEQLCVNTEWQEDELVTEITGKIPFCRLFGRNLLITRKIRTIYGRDQLEVTDTIENLSFEPFELMLLYHMNFGYPFLDETLQLHIPSDKIIDFNGKSPPEDSVKFHEPRVGYEEQVFVHTFPQQEAPLRLSAELENRGIRVRLHTMGLPYLIEWKQLGAGDYALGIEPATAPPCGFIEAQKNGLLKVLAPFEKYETKICLEVQSCW